MSVCTGAFKLAQAGLLEGKQATTHHGSYVEFQHQFPNVILQRDRRYVASDSVIYTSGGLSAGIDLALHIVDGYVGRGIAEATAREMEYEGTGWKRDGTSLVKYSEPAVVHTPAARLSDRCVRHLARRSRHGERDVSHCRASVAGRTRWSGW